ncbi:MAG: DUF4253 domain-containing protein [Bacteroidota bacterium]
MNNLLFLMGILSFLGLEPNGLSPKETKLVQQLDFSIELMNELKKATKSTLTQLPAIEKETADVLDNFHEGIQSEVPDDKATSILNRLKEKFRAEGYLIFVFTQESETKFIGVIQGTNDLDILRYRRTNGINFDLENEDIVSKISAWNAQFGLTVTGCGRDWVELQFMQLPKDLDEFASEVYDFCPDIVDQGVGEVANLKPMIEEMHGIWLWWD